MTLQNPNKYARFANRLLLLAICLSYGFIFFHTAPHYGMTWDQPIDWYFGERNLRYFFTLDKSWLDFSRPVDFSMGGLHPTLSNDEVPWRTLSFGNILSSLGCYIFFLKLHLTDSIVAHQIPNFALMLCVVSAMLIFIRRNFGICAALIGIFSIIFQPRFFADSHFNTKDFPFACIMALTLLAARKGLLKKNYFWILFSSVLLGLSGATKPNAILIPMILFIWYLIARKDASEDNEERKPHKYFIYILLLTPIISMLAYVAAWPVLWASPVQSIKLFLSYYFGVGMIGEAGFQWATFDIFILVQPPAVLIFGSIGTIILIKNILRNDRREPSAFLLIWFAFPVIRVLIPYAHNYDGVRHFIEYAIPLGAITGIGAQKTAAWISLKLNGLKPTFSRFLKPLAFLAIAAPFITWSISSYKIHPYEIVYFNNLLGGAKGVEKFGAFHIPGLGDRVPDYINLSGGAKGAKEFGENYSIATDYWGSSYRQGIEWLNKNAEYESIVVVPVASQVVQSVQNMWMRRDFQLIALPYKNDQSIGQVLGDSQSKPVYVMYITRTAAYGDFVRQVEIKGQKRFSIDVDGVSILKIMAL